MKFETKNRVHVRVIRIHQSSLTDCLLFISRSCFIVLNYLSSALIKLLPFGAGVFISTSTSTPYVRTAVSDDRRKVSSSLSPRHRYITLCYFIIFQGCLVDLIIYWILRRIPSRRKFARGCYYSETHQPPVIQIQLTNDNVSAHISTLCVCSFF